MIKFIAIVIIWLISLLWLLYVELWREDISKIENSQKTYIDQLKDSFYKIIIDDRHTWRKLIWYKNESFNKTEFWYKYTYNINLNKITSTLWDISAKWEINFNFEWQIKDFKLLLRKRYLIKWEREWDTNKIMVSYEDIEDAPSQQSKLLDIEKFNFNFFLLKTLSFRNLKIWKNYSYEVINPSFIQKTSGIKKQKLKIKRNDKYNYSVLNNIAGINFETNITFDNNNQLIKEKIFFVEFILVNDINTKNRIIKNVNQWIKAVESSNITKKADHPINNKNNKEIQNTKQVKDLWKNELEILNITKEVKKISKERIKRCNLLDKK